MDCGDCWNTSNRRMNEIIFGSTERLQQLQGQWPRLDVIQDVVRGAACRKMTTLQPSVSIVEKLTVNKHSVWRYPSKGGFSDNSTQVRRLSLFVFQNNDCFHSIPNVLVTWCRE